MSGPRTEEQWRWAEALALERLWGQDTPLRIADRIGVLTLLGERDGVARMMEIAACFEQMLAADRRAG